MEDTNKRGKVKEEISKLKQLTFRKKLEYIWDYYKPLLAGIIGIVILVCVVVQIVRGSQMVTELSVALVNSQDMGEGSEALKREFTAYSGLNGKNQEVELDSSYVINLNGGDQMTAGSQAKLMAVISAEALDVTVMPENIYVNYLNAGMYQDLAQALGEEFLEANRQICVTGNQEDGGGEKVYGLRLLGNEKLESLYGTEPVVLSIVANTKNTKNAAKFVQYLLS